MFLSGILPINGKGMREFMSSCNNESELVYSDDMLKGICDIHLHAAPDSKARLKMNWNLHKMQKMQDTRLCFSNQMISAATTVHISLGKCYPVLKYSAVFA